MSQNEVGCVLESGDFDLADFDFEDLKFVTTRSPKMSCCRSYLSPKGRCYTCPDEPGVRY